MCDFWNMLDVHLLPEEKKKWVLNSGSANFWREMSWWEITLVLALVIGCVYVLAKIVK